MEKDIYHNKLKNWLDSKSVKYEHLIFQESCHSIEEAINASNEPIEAFVKNVCMIDMNSKLIVAIVSGKDRASTSRVSKALSIERPRIATAKEILELTGYMAGGIPSFSYQAQFLIDPKVTEQEYILTGGGTEYSLLKIKVEDMILLTNAKISRVRK